MTVQWIGPSGSPASGVIMANLNLNIGNTSGNCYLGFFGVGGPQTTPYAILVNSYNSKTYMTNSTGQNLGAAPYGVRGSGQVHNAKFIDTSTVQINSNPSTSVSSATEASGTIMVRFSPTGSFQTQNGVVRAVILNTSSGVTDETALITDVDVRAFEAGHDSAWTTIGANALDNRLFLDDHAANTVHDYHVCISTSPLSVGQKKLFGFLFIVEFL